MWCGIAENAEAYASPVGVGLLKNWYTASTTFDLTLNQPNPDYDSAKHTLNQANNCFCDVAKYISKQDLADFFAQVCRDFGDILARGDFSETQGYMMNAYPQFQTLTAWAWATTLIIQTNNTKACAMNLLSSTLFMFNVVFHFVELEK